MKIIQLILAIIILSGCSATTPYFGNFVDPVPKIIKQVYNTVNDGMIYDKHTGIRAFDIPKLKNGKWHGICSHFATMCFQEGIKAGIDRSRMEFKVYQVCKPGEDEKPHAVLIIDDWVVCMVVLFMNRQLISILVGLTL